jgi:hypothetical protein
MCVSVSNRSQCDVPPVDEPPTRTRLAPVQTCHAGYVPDGLNSSFRAAYLNQSAITCSERVPCECKPCS